MVILKDSTGDTRQDVVVGILGSGSYLNVRTLDMSRLVSCKILRQHLRVAVFSPHTCKDRTVAKAGREAGPGSCGLLENVPPFQLSDPSPRSSCPALTTNSLLLAVYQSDHIRVSSGTGL